MENNGSMTGTRKKVIVGLSGGVDSSVAAALLVEAGFDVTGITMMIYDGPSRHEPGSRHACYGPDEEEDARAAAAVCRTLGIEHHCVDLREEYRTHVLEPFRAAYLAGRTPNPCIGCNRRLKFGFLLEKARRLGIDFHYFATGHYARISSINGGFVLKKAVDEAKDQSYFLYAVRPEQLAVTLFPLGARTKPQVRAIARRLGLASAERTESQDFIAGGSYRLLFSDREAPPGEIVDTGGRVMGRHRGIVHYTVGQRRGLGIAHGRPLYVLAVDAARNRIVVGEREALFSRGLMAAELTLSAAAQWSRPVRAQVKIRLNSPAVPATLNPPQDGRIQVLFDHPQKAVCPGQHAVFYDGDTVLGGGVIRRAL